ncbi:Vi polysaccharide biosynthesis UDP-N-acetylglucosamine C-6 dehydrogenase TviB [Vibrio sp. RE86]|uniref:Vi polysaccharide biosynthesis UDP-N-acetylglucosamine C-6 dehydrogenase TviB n=1 Tax=Vibrio sp. RE86 TaxID=2607605 RepID=UPI0014932AE4|nr:Vi polysaccharide biosynthesis UDP-N-acetylglucosamine C-6 dehydrogenase TviB [Vibrio sp. RE86]
MNLSLENARIGIIGLGYVGLPLAIEFGKKFATLGFDINEKRVAELINGNDSTLECSPDEMKKATRLTYSANREELKNCNIYIVTVPTPIDAYKRPDLTPLIKASEMIGEYIDENNVIIYESTVYPGATEEVCLPIVEQTSGLVFNKDFFAGYSPERINPGDKEHRVTNILKVTSGSNIEVADFVDALYGSVISAGTHKASSIKVAEAAKVIENTQRDANIALINELAIIMNKLDIDTLEVLEAAGTKWNFLPFRPGLVGGHCIGVDPYYLTHKAQASGYIPDMILAGRRINDGMGAHVVTQLVKKMLSQQIHVCGSKVLIMGLAFKENCPDLRNTKVIDILNELENYGVHVDVYDPWCDRKEVQEEYNFSILDEPKKGYYDAIILAVAHDEFKRMGAEEIIALGKKNSVLYDLKYILPKDQVSIRL